MKKKRTQKGIFFFLEEWERINGGNTGRGGGEREREVRRSCEKFIPEKKPISNEINFLIFGFGCGRIWQMPFIS